MIKCSAGTAKVLGLKELKADALPTTAYLMTGERCSQDCAFCSQAKNSSSKADLLSRITWPDFDREKVIEGVVQAFARKELQRTCIQVVSSHNSLGQTQELLRDLKRRSTVPVCVSCVVGTLDAVGSMLDNGADHVSIALDGACERVFVENKGGSWIEKYKLLQEAAKTYPGKIATHLIVGLGETEEEMLQTVQEMIDIEVIVALFAFTPVKGTRLEHAQPPELDHYRRIQAARFLMIKGYGRFEQMYFEEGKLVSFGLPKEKWIEILKDGEAFRTSGCSSCNRPYYNEKPGGIMYNYPLPLTPEQCQTALLELKL